MSEYITGAEFDTQVEALAARLAPHALPRYKVKHETGLKGEQEVWLEFKDLSVSFRVDKPGPTRRRILSGITDIKAREALRRYEADLVPGDGND